MIRERINENGYRENVDIGQTTGTTDYLKDGTIYRDAETKSVMVSSQSDLANLGEYGPGTIAFTAGYVNVWHKGLDGTWTSMV